MAATAPRPVYPTAYLCTECTEVAGTGRSSTLDAEGLAATLYALSAYGGTGHGPLRPVPAAPRTGAGGYARCSVCGCDTLDGLAAYTQNPAPGVWRDYVAEVAALNADRRAFGYYPALRALVLEAAYEGRATYLPAGARDNATARVYIDGVEVGQASACAHRVRPMPTPGGSKFAPATLYPAP